MYCLPVLSKFLSFLGYKRKMIRPLLQNSKVLVTHARAPSIRLGLSEMTGAALLTHHISSLGKSIARLAPESPWF